MRLFHQWKTLAHLLLLLCFSLLEDRFTAAGIYRGTFRHEPDLDLIVQRAVDTGVRRIVLTARTVTESREAAAEAREWNQQFGSAAIHFSCTVGVHPTHCRQVFVDNDNNDNDDKVLLQELLNIAKDGMKDGTVVAVGEIGLDYDRLESCPADIQKKYLVKQLEILAATTGGGEDQHLLTLVAGRADAGDTLASGVVDRAHQLGRESPTPSSKPS